MNRKRGNTPSGTDEHQGEGICARKNSISKTVNNNLIVWQTYKHYMHFSVVTHVARYLIINCNYNIKSYRIYQ